MEPSNEGGQSSTTLSNVIAPWDQCCLDRGRDEFPDAARAESLPERVNVPMEGHRLQACVGAMNIDNAPRFYPAISSIQVIR